MVLTSKQREKLVLDRYNEGKTIKEIAKEAKMSFRDISDILKKKEAAAVNDGSGSSLAPKTIK